VEHLGEPIKMVGNPIKMSGLGRQTFSAPPTLGQHNEEILARYLEYPPQKIQEILSSD